MASKPPRPERIEIPVEDLTDARRRAGQDLELAERDPAIAGPQPAGHTAASVGSAPRSRTGDAWSLSGALRETIVSRWVPVELVLMPYAERFTLIEMSPRRVVRPNRRYFRAGHRSLDRFVAAVRTKCPLAVT